MVELTIGNDGVAFGALALGLTIAMFVTKNMLLGFPSFIFWAILGGYFYQESTTTWDLEYISFFACMGMAIFCGVAMYALRRRDLSGPDTDDGNYIDGKGASSANTFMEGKESDEFDLDDGATKQREPSQRRQELHKRAERRRSGDIQRKTGWGEFS